MTQTFAAEHPAVTANIQVGALYVSQPDRLDLGIFAGLLRALHESRRQQAERVIRRHQHLLDCYAKPPMREQSSGRGP